MFAQGKERARCELTAAQCELFLKTHVSGLDDKAYQGDDYDCIVKSYNGFLCAVAGATSRLTSTMVRSAAKKVFAADDKAARDFGDSMSGALSYCYSKGLKATSGKKLTDGVKAVVLSFGNVAALRPVQAALSGQPSPGKPCASKTLAPGTPGESGHQAEQIEPGRPPSREDQDDVGAVDVTSSPLSVRGVRKLYGLQDDVDMVDLVSTQNTIPDTQNSIPEPTEDSIG